MSNKLSTYILLTPFMQRKLRREERAHERRGRQRRHSSGSDSEEEERSKRSRRKGECLSYCNSKSQCKVLIHITGMRVFM